jgi:hypothetical protein
MRDLVSRQTIQLTIFCVVPGGDQEEIESRTEQLREELIEADIETLTKVPGPVAPPGAKAADPMTIGALLVTLAASRGVLVALLQTLQAWIKRHDNDSITIEGKGGMKVKINGRMSAAKNDLIEAWIDRQLKS